MQLHSWPASTLQPDLCEVSDTVGDAFHTPITADQEGKSLERETGHRARHWLGSFLFKAGTFEVGRGRTFLASLMSGNNNNNPLLFLSVDKIIKMSIIFTLYIAPDRAVQFLRTLRVASKQGGLH